MKKLLIVLFALLFGTISFSRIAQSTEFIVDGDKIDVSIGDVVIINGHSGDIVIVDGDEIDVTTDDVVIIDGDEVDIITGDVVIVPPDDDDTITIYMDIKPGSCENSINVKSKGVLAVAILGTEDFDVTNIDPITVQLAGVAALRSSIEDVSQPLNVEDCEDYGVDGYADLKLKFDTQEIVAALGADIGDGDLFELNLTGTLADDTQIEGADTVLILKKGKK